MDFQHDEWIEIRTSDGQSGFFRIDKRAGAIGPSGQDSFADLGGVRSCWIRTGAVVLRDALVRRSLAMEDFHMMDDGFPSRLDGRFELDCVMFAVEVSRKPDNSAPVGRLLGGHFLPVISDDQLPKIRWRLVILIGRRLQEASPLESPAGLLRYDSVDPVKGSGPGSEYDVSRSVLDDVILLVASVERPAKLDNGGSVLMRRR